MTGAAETLPAERPWRAAARLAGDSAGLPDWPAGRRQAALARLDATGLPDSNQEDWRYTSLKAWGQRWATYLAAAPERVGLVAGPAGEGHRDGGTAHHPGTVHLEVVDGRLRQAPHAPPGLFVGSLRQMTPGLRARASELLGRSAGLVPDALVDLNSALLADVIIIATEPGSGLEATPVHVHLVGGASPSFDHPRILVDVAAASRLTLCLEHAGTDGTLANAVTEAWIGSGGHLDLIRVQALPDDGMLTDTSRIELAGSATAKITSVDLGGLLSRHSMTVVLAGAGASVTLDGMFLADGRRHIDNRTRVEHQAPATTSRESFRGLADDHGRGVFNGKIIVMPGAAGSNAALSNRNLLLTATAEIDTKPELEIYVDDVRCSHGATTGRLDDDALFYLRSRGLDPDTARQVLIAAFLREAIGQIGLPELRDRLDARLEALLAGHRTPSGPGPGP